MHAVCFMPTLMWWRMHSTWVASMWRRNAGRGQWKRENNTVEFDYDGRQLLTPFRPQLLINGGQTVAGLLGIDGARTTTSYRLRKSGSSLDNRLWGWEYLRMQRPSPPLSTDPQKVVQSAHHFTLPRSSFSSEPFVAQSSRRPLAANRWPWPSLPLANLLHRFLFRNWTAFAWAGLG